MTRAGGRKHASSALFTLALTTGLRQGELLGLRWRDLDLDGATLAVDQQVYRLRREWVFASPKSSQGRRTVSLTASAVDALCERRLEQNAERLRAKGWTDYDLVFANPHGEPMEKTALLYSLVLILKRAGLAPMRFHDLRHSAATLLLQENVNPKIVQEMLGHSSISMTMDVYSHVMPSLQRDAAEKMDRLLAASS